MMNKRASRLNKFEYVIPREIFSPLYAYYYLENKHKRMLFKVHKNKKSTVYGFEIDFAGKVP